MTQLFFESVGTRGDSTKEKQIQLTSQLTMPSGNQHSDLVSDRASAELGNLVSRAETCRLPFI